MYQRSIKVSRSTGTDTPSTGSRPSSSRRDRLVQVHAQPPLLEPDGVTMRRARTTDTNE